MTPVAAVMGIMPSQPPKYQDREPPVEGNRIQLARGKHAIRSPQIVGNTPITALS